ncbi:MAG: PIN domain-containing protein [Clostridiales Family XIII bacterium]|jgi:predicted nucleic acid-binding protein|nr:PIN domain-containing protein [Clostridiales Family XIII bacterium]
MKVMVDTNVALDALLARAPFSEAAEEILLASARREIVACITASAITDIYYLIKKYLKDGAKSKRALRDLMDLVEVTDVRGHDCEVALDAAIDDYEGALLCVCAQKAKVDCIVTRDGTHYRNSPVPVVAPSVLVAEIGGGRHGNEGNVD